MDKTTRDQKKAQEYSRKQKEQSMKVNIDIQTSKIEKNQTLEEILEETHQNEDVNADFVANDMLKQSSELQRRLAERRKQARAINSCKNSNSKSFFSFNTTIVNDKIEKMGQKQNMPNLSIIKNNNSDENEDESFSFDILNNLNHTDSSTNNVHSRLMNQPNHPHLKIETSMSDEEEEEESEDEQLEKNLMEIWNECEKVFETIQTEKEEATNKFLEEFTSDKFEKIAEDKAEMKIRIKDAKTEQEKSTIENEYKIKILEIEKTLSKVKENGLSDIKKKFRERKMSIVSKLDMESAKNKLKASL
jgi:hypothetical protein